MPLFNLGVAALLQGRHTEALARLRTGLQLTRDLEYAGQSVYFLEGLAVVFAAGEQAESAGRPLGAAEAAGEGIGVVLEPSVKEIHDRTVDGVRAALGRDGFALAHALGRALELQQAIDYALETAGEPTESTDGFTARPDATDRAAERRDPGGDARGEPGFRVA